VITPGVKTLDEVGVYNVHSHRKIEIDGTEIFHFEKDQIKEGWTMFNMVELVKRLFLNH
jgi:hypothetical protein